MKKFVVFLMAIAIACVSCAYADMLSTEEVIRFRGLEWGCSIEDAAENLREAGVSDHARISSGFDVRYIDFSTCVDNAGFTFDPSSYMFDNDIFVGGHMVEQIAVNAIYGFVNGEVSSDVADSRIYCGSYYFKEQANMKSVYDDLVSKLTSLYGVPQENPYANYGSFSCIWYGANHTAVEINMLDSDTLPLLHISFWDLSVGDAIAEMQNALYVNDPFSLDGLS